MLQTFAYDFKSFRNICEIFDRDYFLFQIIFVEVYTFGFNYINFIDFVVAIILFNIIATPIPD